MRYPNLRAEYDATSISEATFSSQANITKELFLEILRGNEEPTTEELRAMYYLLAGFTDSSREHFSFGYLSAPKLATVEPDTAKALYRRHILHEAIAAADATESIKCGSYAKALGKAKDILHQMEHGKTITYAAYRNALLEVRMILLFDQARNRVPRGMARKVAV